MPPKRKGQSVPQPANPKRVVEGLNSSGRTAKGLSKDKEEVKEAMSTKRILWFLDNAPVQIDPQDPNTNNKSRGEVAEEAALAERIAAALVSGEVIEEAIDLVVEFDEDRSIYRGIGETLTDWFKDEQGKAQYFYSYMCAIDLKDKATVGDWASIPPMEARPYLDVPNDDGTTGWDTFVSKGRYAPHVQWPCYGPYASTTARLIEKGREEAVDIARNRLFDEEVPLRGNVQKEIEKTEQTLVNIRNRLNEVAWNTMYVPANEDNPVSAASSNEDEEDQAEDDASASHPNANPGDGEDGSGVVNAASPAVAEARHSDESAGDEDAGDDDDDERPDEDDDDERSEEKEDNESKDDDGSKDEENELNGNDASKTGDLGLQGKKLTSAKPAKFVPDPLITIPCHNFALAFATHSRIKRRVQEDDDCAPFPKPFFQSFLSLVQMVRWGNDFIEEAIVRVLSDSFDIIVLCPIVMDYLTGSLNVSTHRKLYNLFSRVRTIGRTQFYPGLEFAFFMLDRTAVATSLRDNPMVFPSIHARLDTTLGYNCLSDQQYLMELFRELQIELTEEFVTKKKSAVRWETQELCTKEWIETNGLIMKPRHGMQTNGIVIMKFMKAKPTGQQTRKKTKTKEKDWIKLLNIHGRVYPDTRRENTETNAIYHDYLCEPVHPDLFKAKHWSTVCRIHSKTQPMYEWGWTTEFPMPMQVPDEPRVDRTAVNHGPFYLANDKETSEPFRTVDSILKSFNQDKSEFWKHARGHTLKIKVFKKMTLIDDDEDIVPAKKRRKNAKARAAAKGPKYETVSWISRVAPVPMCDYGGNLIGNNDDRDYFHWNAENICSGLCLKALNCHGP